MTNCIALLLSIAIVLSATSNAVEKVSTYISPSELHLWENYTQYLYQDAQGEYELVDHVLPEKANKTRRAFVIVNSSYNDLGWDFIYVSGDEASSTDVATRSSSYYHAGVAEGWATAERIQQIYSISVTPNLPYVGKYEAEWIDQHIAFMKKSVLENEKNDPFWNKVGDLFALMEGIADGFGKSKYAQENKLSRSFHDIFLLNFANEVLDVVTHFNNTFGAQSAKKLKAQMLRSQHCSALVKVLPDDIFFSHDTWSSFYDMLRQYKTYAMETTVTMSGFAGTIASGDDWYMTSNSLAVQETTNDFYDVELAMKYIVPHTVSEFLRVMVANFITDNGKSWTEQFARYNSGTYCNQYMVLDAKLYTPNAPLVDNLFWVAEQMPGNVTSGDQTAVLSKQGYWASYNIPFYKNIYDQSGFARLEREQGTFWSYHKYARAEIFARNQSYVKDLDGMRKMMRYNNWQVDPFSKIPNCTDCTPNSPMLSIASRGDLVPANAVLPKDPHFAMYFERNAFGDIDSKITSAMMVKDMKSTVICGPTHESQVPFQYSKTSYTRPGGLVDLFDFDWVTFVTPVAMPTPVTASPHAATPAPHGGKGHDDHHHHHHGSSHDDGSKGLTGAAKGLIAFIVIFFVVVFGAIFVYRRKNQQGTGESDAPLTSVGAGSDYTSIQGSV